MITELVRYLDEDGVPSESVSCAIRRWGDDSIRMASRKLIGCLELAVSLTNRRSAPDSEYVDLIDCDVDNVLRQWVELEPELKLLFEVSNSRVMLRRDIPAVERHAIANLNLHLPTVPERTTSGQVLQMADIDAIKVSRCKRQTLPTLRAIG